MYTMVLMMAATTGGDTASFGLLRGSCHGSCHGAKVVATAPASCTGITVVASSSCTGTTVSSCTGTTVSSCTGNSCHGSGFLGLRGKLGGLFNRSSCLGSTSCTGSVPTPAPACGGCDVAPAVTTNCPPATAVVGSTTPPVATMPKAEPKKEEPKKDEPKKKMD